MSAVRKPDIHRHAKNGNTVEAAIARAIDSGDFEQYRIVILHDWMHALCKLAAVLVPLFFVLDVFMMPPALLPRFAIYRSISAFIAIVQFLIIRKQKPSRWTFLYAYLMSTQISVIISIMTLHLGGFNSSYYAGLNLIIIGVNLLMPWKAYHTAINAAVTLLFYAGSNLFIGHQFEPSIFINNMFFLGATSIIVTCITYVRYRLLKNEFLLLLEVKKTRDALWSEMELAKRIQTALLPKVHSIRGYDVATVMLPAADVGGDYFDIIETVSGDRWITIGDVSGHGVDSGLIMMMAQTSVMTKIKSVHACHPVNLLSTTNAVLRENIARLGSNHYMTMMVMQLEDDKLMLTGHHQDVMISRAADRTVSSVATKGTWLGIADNIDESMETRTITIADNDMVLLYTDGATEGANSTGELFGQERLQAAFERHASASTVAQDVLNGILKDIQAFQSEQADDISLVLVRKLPRGNNNSSNTEV
ncbi:MAG: SpoIIE family protein phosphatase [Spirochaetes bacterium]|nr:SpoIIE family protein phosphatase [Spirochaetota bacterium]